MSVCFTKKVEIGKLQKHLKELTWGVDRLNILET